MRRGFQAALAAYRERSPVTVRVVLYAEGAGDRAGELMLPVAPTGLIDAHLGPAHFLVRRVVSDVHAIPESAVQFYAPLRWRGREARGSDLLVRQTLRQLLTWLNPETRPHLAVVLIDADGVPGRRDQVEGHIASLASRPIVIVAVAVQEFESWLIADNEAASRATGLEQQPIDDVEALLPGEAKARLVAAPGVSSHAARTTVANHADLQRIRARSRSFARFCEAVEVLAVPGSRRS